MVARLCRHGHALDNPFLQVTLPACEIRRSVNIEVKGHTTDVLDMEQFGAFINDIMFNETVLLWFSGSAKAQYRGIKSRLEVTDNVEVAGTFQ